jgi:hypothetical protein
MRFTHSAASRQQFRFSNDNCTALLKPRYETQLDLWKRFRNIYVPFVCSTCAVNGTCLARVGVLHRMGFRVIKILTRF